MNTHVKSISMRPIRRTLRTIYVTGTLLAVTTTIGFAADVASDEAAKLAKMLANPIASLVSIPLQYNYDENYGSKTDGSISKLNFQPVIPFTLNED